LVDKLSYAIGNSASRGNVIGHLPTTTMSKIFFISTITLVLFACNTANEKTEDNLQNSQTAGDGIFLKKFDGVTVTGDFDGDKKIDTITQHIGSKYKKGDFDSIVDPFKNHRDIVTNWHFNRVTDLYLTVNRPEIDALHLGSSQGLYCLINIGDNNSDKKDEIALVTDQLDASSVNRCKIFSICNGQWSLLKEFGINEASFSSGDKDKVFSEIPKYLEHKDNKWLYKDYSLTEFIKEDTVVEMQTLKIEKCK
jgi:hypothetical protein